jgi:hypothetical protein
VKVSRGAMMVVAALWPSLLALAEFDRRGGVPQLSFIVLALAPLTLWIAELPLFETQKPWQRVGVRVLLVAIPVGIALAMALIASQSEGEYEF